MYAKGRRRVIKEGTQGLEESEGEKINTKQNCNDGEIEKKGGGNRRSKKVTRRGVLVFNCVVFLMFKSFRFYERIVCECLKTKRER